MTTSDIQKEIKELDIAERILLVEAIWDSVADQQSDVSVTKAQRDKLDERLGAFKQSPSDGSSWQEVKSRILKNK